MIFDIQQVSNVVKTGYGVLVMEYEMGGSLFTLQGIEQGSGLGPSGCAVISSSLFEDLRSAGFVPKYVSCFLGPFFWLVTYLLETCSYIYRCIGRQFNKEGTRRGDFVVNFIEDDEGRNSCGKHFMIWDLVSVE